MSKASVASPASFSLADEIEKSIKRLSNEQLHQKILEAASNRNRIAASIRKVNESLDAVDADRGRLELLVSISPEQAERKTAELDAREQELKAQRRTLEAAYRGAGDIIPLVEVEQKQRESAVALAEHEILMRRFPTPLGRVVNGRRVSTKEGNELLEQAAHMLIAEILHHSFFGGTIDGQPLTSAVSRAKALLEQARNEARAEAVAAIEKARMRA